MICAVTKETGWHKVHFVHNYVGGGWKYYAADATLQHQHTHIISIIISYFGAIFTLNK